MFQKPKTPRIDTDGLFIDDEFPADDNSVYRNKPISKPVTWKRPGVRLT